MFASAHGSPLVGFDQFWTCGCCLGKVYSLSSVARGNQKEMRLLCLLVLPAVVFAQGFQIPTSGQQPTSGFRIPTSGQQPTPGFRIPASGQQPTSGFRIPTSGQQATSGLRIPTSGQQATSGFRIPTSGQQPTSGLRIPTSGQKPTQGFQIPTSGQQPGGSAGRNVAAELASLLSVNIRNNELPPSTVGPLDSCKTPDGLEGRCGALSRCDFFRPFLEAVHQPTVLDFFRARLCRLKEFHFCCPISPTAQAEQARKPILPSTDECGVQSSVRIIGGNEISPGSWPWLVTLGLPRADSTFFHYCGGTLITRRHVLTAAHCFDPRVPDPTHVRLGEFHLGTDDDGTIPQEIKIRSRRLFGFDKTTFENDIALLTLDRDAEFNDFVRPACLPINPPVRNSIFDGDQLTVVGWGKTTFGPGATSLTPREVRIPTTPLDACREFYLVNNVTVDDRNICAGVLGRDSCQGDSGGPLNYFDEKTGRYYVVGIVSNGHLCGVYPGIYTRVGAFINWIMGNLQ